MNTTPSWRIVLTPVAWLFGILVRLRNALFDTGIRQQVRLPRPVVSVGNLAMGGTGKSPICNDLIGRLSAQNLSVCLLSRGYGRQQPKTSRIITKDTDWHLAGDEPLMLARNHPYATVCVGPSRYEAAQKAPVLPDLYLIDDGFQHRQLSRDLDIVLIDVNQGSPKLFPVKNFREPLSSLKRADLAVLTRWDGSETSEWERAIKAVHPDLPILRAKFQPGRLHQVFSSRTWSVSDLKNKPVAAYTGIAKPNQFFDLLSELGCHVVTTLALNDHQPLDDEIYERFSEQIRNSGAAWIVTTEKDAVKLDKTYHFDIVVAYLTLEVVWDDPGTLLHHVERLMANEES